MGSCVSHKSIIVKKVVLERKDPLAVAQETNHSIGAVDRYLKDFNRASLCHQDVKNAEFISLATGLNKTVVRENLKIIKAVKISSSHAIWHYHRRTSNLNAALKVLVLGGKWVARRMKAIRFYLINIEARVMYRSRQLGLPLSKGHRAYGWLLAIRAWIMGLVPAPLG